MVCGQGSGCGAQSGLPRLSQGICEPSDVLQGILSCKPTWILLLPLTTPSDMGPGDFLASTLIADLSRGLIKKLTAPGAPDMHFFCKSPQHGTAQRGS